MKRARLLSSAMVAKILGFSPDYIRKLCANGTIRAERLGHDWLIFERDIKNVKRQRKPKKGKE